MTAVRCWCHLKCSKPKNYISTDWTFELNIWQRLKSLPPNSFVLNTYFKNHRVWLLKCMLRIVDVGGALLSSTVIQDYWRYKTQRLGAMKIWLSCNASNALCNKHNGSCDIKDFGILSPIFSTSKSFRRKFQPCPSFFPHPNIPDKWKRLSLSLDQMKKKEKVKEKS